MLSRRERGASAVEFAIIAPVVFLLFFAFFEFGIMLYDAAMIKMASREGARAGIVFANSRPTIDDIRNVVNNYCVGHLIPNTVIPNTTTVPADPTTLSSGDHLTVTVAFSYPWLTPLNPLRVLWASLFGVAVPDLDATLDGASDGIINLQVHTTMRAE